MPDGDRGVGKQRRGVGAQRQPGERRRRTGELRDSGERAKPGMGARKAEAIAQAWQERRALKEIMVFLQSQGLPVALAVRILRKYGSAAEQRAAR